MKLPGLKVLLYTFLLKCNRFLFQMTQRHQDTAPCDHTLEYALHSLLRRRHHQAQALPTPRPVTAYPTQGGSKRLCLAGASALTAAEVAPCLQRCVVSIDVLRTCIGHSVPIFFETYSYWSKKVESLVLNPRTWLVKSASG